MMRCRGHRKRTVVRAGRRGRFGFWAFRGCFSYSSSSPLDMELNSHQSIQLTQNGTNGLPTAPIIRVPADSTANASAGLGKSVLRSTSPLSFGFMINCVNNREILALASIIPVFKLRLFAQSNPTSRQSGIRVT